MYLRAKIDVRMKTKTITFDRFVRILGAVILLIGAYLLMYQLRGVLTPFLVAWLVAYLLHPIVCFFQYKCRLKSRLLSIVVTLLLLVGIIVGGLMLIIPPITDEIMHLKDIIVSYITTDANVISMAGEVESFIRHNIDVNELVKALTISDVSQFLGEQMPRFLSFLGNGISAIIGIIGSVIAVIYLFFILLDYEIMVNGFFKLVPKNKRELVHGVLKDLEDGMNGYFRGQTIIAMCVGVLFAIGFLIIDFPLAIPLGLFIGFLNLVPYLQTVGFIPTIMLAMLKAHDTGQNFWSILIAAIIVFGVVQTIQDVILTPRIMGKVMGLNAAVILLSLSIWGCLLGFVGLIIALPLTTLIISYYKRYILEERKEESGNTPTKE